MAVFKVGDRAKLMTRETREGLLDYTEQEGLIMYKVYTVTDIGGDDNMMTLDPPGPRNYYHWMSQFVHAQISNEERVERRKRKHAQV